METSKDSWEMEKINEGSIILKHTKNMLSETSFTKNSFLNDRVIPALIADGCFDDAPEGISGDDYLKFMENKRRALQYILDGRHRFPIEYKWPWINCMLPDYRDACLRDVLAMHGTLFVPLPKTTDDRMPADSRIFDLTQEFADVQRASRPAHDGVYSVSDGLEPLKRLSNELLELAEASINEMRLIEQGTGVVADRIEIFKSTKFFDQSE